MDPILTAIEAADLSLAEYRAARRLLDRLIPGHSLLYLTRAESVALCGVESWPAARRIFSGLAKVGVIELHTNSRAYIHFVARAETDQDRAETDQDRAETARGFNGGRAETDQDRAETDQDRAETDQDRAETARPIGKVPTGKVGRKDQPTYLPVVEGVQGETLTDAERSLALLTDPAVGVTGKLLEIVALYPFEQIRLQVFQALREMAEKRVKSIGVIRHRLAVGAAATVTDADRASALWLRHQMDDEGEAERRRKYMPAEYADIIIG